MYIDIVQASFCIDNISFSICSHNLNVAFLPYAPSVLLADLRKCFNTACWTAHTVNTNFIRIPYTLAQMCDVVLFAARIDGYLDQLVIECIIRLVKYQQQEIVILAEIEIYFSITPYAQNVKRTRRIFPSGIAWDRSNI